MTDSKKTQNKQVQIDQLDGFKATIGVLAFFWLMHSLILFTMIISFGSSVGEFGIPKLVLVPTTALALITSLDLLIREKKGSTVALLISYILFVVTCIFAPREALLEDWPFAVIKIAVATFMLYFYKERTK